MGDTPRQAEEDYRDTLLLLLFLSLFPHRLSGICTPPCTFGANCRVPPYEIRATPVRPSWCRPGVLIEWIVGWSWLVA